MAASDLTAARLREVFCYDPDTGVLTWRVSPNKRIKAGDAVGSVDNEGYTRLKVDGKRYLQHRVIWLMQAGEWPTGQIDHINGARSDNRWQNLRDVRHAVNNQNQRRALPANKTGLLGVSLERGRFRAEIQIDGKTKYLGAFDTPELAHGAYLDAKRRLHVGCTI